MAVRATGAAAGAASAAGPRSLDVPPARRQPVDWQARDRAAARWRPLAPPHPPSPRASPDRMGRAGFDCLPDHRTSRDATGAGAPAPPAASAPRAARSVSGTWRSGALILGSIMRRSATKKPARRARGSPSTAPIGASFAGFVPSCVSRSCGAFVDHPRANRPAPIQARPLRPTLRRACGSMPPRPMPIAYPPLPRRVFCNRTLNMRSIQVMGCDMDYTLVHYDSQRWERSAYEYMKRAFVARGWPVAGLEFDPDLVSLGLVMDLERGNLVKANRFGHVRNASHGTSMLGFEGWREAYGTAPIDLAESRWQFMNTLFSLSEACLYTQLVDLLDQGKLEPGLSYRALYAEVRTVLDATHLEGALKAEILARPGDYVLLDEELPAALLELRAAGKKLLLITNSEWTYTQSMMSYAFDRFLPAGSTW